MTGFSFINPSYLWALPLAGVPLLIHILSRRRRRIVEFSSVMLLVKAQRQNVERISLREVLLLILRTLAVLLLVLAAARPLVRGFWGAAVTDHEPTGVALVFDRTLSMRYTADEMSAFEHSLERARGILDLLGEGDRVIIFTSDRKTATLSGRDALLPHEAGKYLEGLEPTTYGGTLDECLAAARARIREMDQPWKETYVFTDLQEGSVSPGIFDDAGGDGENMPIVFFTERDSGAVNKFLGEAAIVRRDDSEERPWSLSVVTGSSGSAGRPAVFPRLYLNGEMAGIVEVQTRPGETGTAFFPLRSFPDPGSRVRVEIEKDGLREDDVTYFMPGEEKRLEIRRGTGVESVKLLKIALDLLEVGEGRAAPVLVTFWSDSEGIRQAVDRGIGLVLFPEPGGGARLAGTALPIESAGQQSTAGFITIASPSGNSLPACFTELVTGFSRVRVKEYYRLIPGPAWEVAGSGPWRLDLEGGDPFLSGGDVNGSRIVVWSVSPEEESTDLFRAPLFLPLLDGMLRYASGIEEERGCLAGESFTIGTHRSSAEGPVSVSLPGGGEFLAKQGPGGQLLFDHTEEPGFYAVSAGGRVVSEFTVNVDIRESNMREIDEKTLAAMLACDSVSVVRKGARLEESILLSRGGREVSSWLLLALLGVFLAESHLSGRIKRQ